MPLGVKCGVFVMKHYQHGGGRHASSHGTAVYVLSATERERRSISPRTPGSLVLLHVLPEILLHPVLQLFGDLLFLPLTHICHKHPRVEGAVSGVDAQLSDFLFPVIQEAHVGGLRNEVKMRNVTVLYMSLNTAAVKSSSMKERHLHADAAHHLVCGGQVTVSGKSSSVSRFELDVKQVLDVS